MGVLTIALVAASALSILAASHYDRKLQEHRAPGAPRSAFQFFAPIRLIDPELYTPAGARYRTLALRAIVLWLLFFVLAMLSFSIGL